MKNYEDNYRVEIVSNSCGRVGITLPELRFKRVWEKKGAKKYIDFGILREAIYESGVLSLFQQGFLIIPDLEVKIALGLEPDNVKEPTEIIVLDDNLKKRALTVMPMVDFKALLKKIPHEQIMGLTDYAIIHELAPLDKLDLLKEYTDIDVLKAIQLNRSAKEG